MASSSMLFPSPVPATPSPTPLQQGKVRSAVYVSAVPLRAAQGPAQLLMTTAYSLGLWDLQHFMVAIKPNPSHSQVFVFDFQPQNPENVYVALSALSRRQVQGVVLKRKLRGLPKSRCWFIGFSDADAVDLADQFNEKWPTNLIIGKHDCRHYTSGNTSFYVILDSSHPSQDFNCDSERIYACIMSLIANQPALS